MLSRLSWLARPLTGAVPQVAACQAASPVATPFRMAITSNKSNKSTRNVAKHHAKRTATLALREGTTRFDLFPEVTLRDFRRYVLRSSSWPHSRFS